MVMHDFHLIGNAFSLFDALRLRSCVSAIHNLISLFLIFTVFLGHLLLSLGLRQRRGVHYRMDATPLGLRCGEDQSLGCQRRLTLIMGFERPDPSFTHR